MARVDRWAPAPLLRIDPRRAPRTHVIQERMDRFSRRRRWNSSGGHKIMTAPHADQTIDGYLTRIRDAAGDLPAAARKELLGDMRGHIAEARALEPEETAAKLLHI